VGVPPHHPTNFISGSKGKGGTYNEVIGHAVRLAPGIHNESIIARNEDHVVYTLGLELVDVLKVGDEVLLLACRRECARHSDQDYLLVLELCLLVSLVLTILWRGEGPGGLIAWGRPAFVLTGACIVLDRDATFEYVVVLRGRGDVGEGDSFGEGVSSLERSHIF